MEILGYCASLLIGISLGLIGGGGSILTVPILVYLFGIDPEKATSYSLFVVGATAAIGAYKHYRMGNLKLRPALQFAVPSVASLLLVRKLFLPAIPAQLFEIGTFAVTKNLLIMVVFAVLMLAASLSMIRKSAPEAKTPQAVRLQALSLMGFGVGIVTGFLGAGGGFLIIPALVFFAKLPMKQAVGTSLLIIALNSLIGFGGDLVRGVSLQYQLLFAVSGIALAGLFLGTYWSRKIDGQRLKPVFGWFVLVMGVYILVQEVLG